MWDPRNTRDLLNLMTECEKLQRDEDDKAEAEADVSSSIF